jgi:hypothetical protein
MAPFKAVPTKRAGHPRVLVTSKLQQQQWRCVSQSTHASLSCWDNSCGS